MSRKRTMDHRTTDQASKPRCRTQRTRAALLVAIVFLVGALTSPQDAQAASVLLVRHAEKVSDGSKNPLLSSAGIERAAALADALRKTELTAIYSTDFCRTAQTAAPIAAQLGLPIHLQRIGASDSSAGADRLAACEPAVEAERRWLESKIDTPSQFAEYLRVNHPTDTVLVVGHSNTVPELIAALIGEDFAVEIGEDEYGDLFIVDAPVLLGGPSMIHARYGR